MVLPTPFEIERAGLLAWPSIELEWDGSWVRRAAGGYTQRANSIQCFDPADDHHVEMRVAAARRWHEDRGVRPTFRVNLLTGPHLRAHLDAERWVAVDHSMLMAMPLREVEGEAPAEILAVDDPDFLAAQVALKHWDDVTLAKFKAIIAMYTVPACGIVLRGDDGKALSSALMAIANGIVITGNVVTAAAERGKGHALRMMRTGLAWAHREGARFAALNVAADNPPAIALYERLGYRRQYDYVYRTPGAV